MTDLKTAIARGEYEIDSRKVAGAIIDKVRIVSRVRTHITSQSAQPAGHFAGRRAHRRAIR